MKYILALLLLATPALAFDELSPAQQLELQDALINRDYNDRQRLKLERERFEWEKRQQRQWEFDRTIDEITELKRRPLLGRTTFEYPESYP